MSDDILLDKRKTFWRLVLIFIGITYIGLSFYLFLRYNITAPFSIDDEKITNSILIAFCAFAVCLAFIFIFVYSLYLKIRLQIIKERQEAKEEKIKIANDALEEQSYRDEISSLPRFFVIGQQYEQMQHANAIVVEIDEFDKISTYYSYKMLLKVITQVVRKLKEFGKKSDFLLYRINDARFGLIKKDPNMQEDELHSYVKMINKDLKGFEISTPEEIIDISCTIGYCVFGDQSVKKAILALQLAKSHFLDYASYSIETDFTKFVNNERQNYTMIDKAIVTNTIVPYFQPIYDREGNITKYETLIRIIDEKDELILPEFFLNYSKRIKRYKEISKRLISKAIDIAQEQSQNAVISINMAFSDMTDNDISTFVLKKIDKSGIGPRLVVEILETEEIHQDEMLVKEYIEALKKRKVRIAVDDFGRGYSNFGLFLKIVPDFLKIDGSLIKDIHSDELSKNAVLAIVAFAKKLGITTTAEFVCSRPVYECCLELGIDEFQGFYLGKPSASLKD